MTDEFDKLFGQAVALHQQGKMAEAVQAYVQLFTKAPRHSDIYNNLRCCSSVFG